MASKNTGKKRQSTTKSLKASKPKAKQDGKLSILDAAARVLTESGGTMSCKQMVERMIDAKYWQTSGKTPAATLSSAIQREIKTKKDVSRFKKVERGQFTLN